MQQTTLFTRKSNIIGVDKVCYVCLLTFTKKDKITTDGSEGSMLHRHRKGCGPDTSNWKNSNSADFLN